MERLPLGQSDCRWVADLGGEEIGRLASHRWRPPPRASPCSPFWLTQGRRAAGGRAWWKLRPGAVPISLRGLWSCNDTPAVLLRALRLPSPGSTPFLTDSDEEWNALLCFHGIPYLSAQCWTHMSQRAVARQGLGPEQGATQGSVHHPQNVS